MSNVFSFTGTVGRDCEQRFLPSGQAVLNVAVACNTGYGDKQQTMWIRVALFGKRAEGTLKDYLVKGQAVFISGELSNREYQANDGTTKSNLELNATILDLVGGKREGGQQQGYQPAPTQQRPPAQGQQAGQQKPRDNFEDYNDDIPFG
jgi:single-strand DNA-binding protein